MQLAEHLTTGSEGPPPTDKKHEIIGDPLSGGASQPAFVQGRFQRGAKHKPDLPQKISLPLGRYLPSIEVRRDVGMLQAKKNAQSLNY